MFYVTLMPHWRFSKDDNCIHMPLLQIFKNQLNHPPKRIYIFKLKHCLYWIIFVKQYNSMFRINCTSTCFYVINTIVCYLNEISWNNWFYSCIHCYAPFWKKNCLRGWGYAPGTFYTEPPPRVDHWVSNICIYTTNSCFAYTSNQYLVYDKFFWTICSSNIIFKSNYQKSK